jgi:Mg2+ and Co2+ transporter CorA
MLLASLLFASCQTGNGALNEANRLNQSAGDDVKEIEKLVQENRDKESSITRAINADKYDEARQAIDQAVNAIDRGLGRGLVAQDKLNTASKLDVDADIKQYLSLRAQSVSKALEAFAELRNGLIILRESTGSTDKAVKEKAKNEIQESSATFDQLISESERLEGQADDIARRNPDKIKPGR